MMHVFHDHLKLQKESYIRGFLSKRKRKKERETDTHTRIYTYIYIHTCVCGDVCDCYVCLVSVSDSKISATLFLLKGEI